MQGMQGLRTRFDGCTAVVWYCRVLVGLPRVRTVVGNGHCDFADSGKFSALVGYSRATPRMVICLTDEHAQYVSYSSDYRGAVMRKEF